MSNAGRGPSRRRVLTGAAWAAPAIVVASAAPATAASGPAAVTVTNVTGVRNPSVVPPGLSRLVNIAANLANSNTQATVGLQVQLVITLPATATFGSTPIVTNASGYDVPAGTVSGQSVTFLFTAVRQLEGASGTTPTTKPFSPAVDLMVNSSGTLTVTPIVGGGGTVTPGTGAFA